MDGISPQARMGAFHFQRRSGQPNRLTPHPGPLPVEGRGGAADVEVLTDAFTASCPVVSAGVICRTRHGTGPFQSACIAAPSPLNGERAVVRGENAQGSADFQLRPARILHELRAYSCLNATVNPDICLP